MEDVQRPVPYAWSTDLASSALYGPVSWRKYRYQSLDDAALFGEFHVAFSVVVTKVILCFSRACCGQLSVVQSINTQRSKVIPTAFMKRRHDIKQGLSVPTICGGSPRTIAGRGRSMHAQVHKATRRVRLMQSAAAERTYPLDHLFTTLAMCCLAGDSSHPNNFP